MLTFKLVVLYVVNNFVSKLFFHISYNFTGKWNLDIDFFQVLDAHRVIRHTCDEDERT